MGTDEALIGRTLGGRYRITGLVGQGGMATVYRGTQEGHEPHEVAVKILNPSLARDGTFVKRFHREAKSAARLKHRSTVRIFDYGVEGGLPYIVMELIHGAELVQILHHERRLPEARAARIMGQVCSALASAHEQGIVHRDLKPENVMLLRDPKDPSAERVKVLDFGIAKIMEPELRPEGAPPPDSDEPPPSSLGRTALTMVGTIVGTPEYMSPEQSKGETLDARSDVYACGVLLYHLVTGRVPFAGDSPFETAMMHVTETARPPRDLTPSINPRLEAMILKAMAKSPADRFQSARELQELLVELLPELSMTRHMSIPAPTDRPPSVDTELANQPTIVAPRQRPATAPATGSPAASLVATLSAGKAPAILSAPDPSPAALEPVPAPTESRPEAPALALPQGPTRMSDGIALLVGIGLGAIIVALTALVLFLRR